MIKDSNGKSFKIDSKQRRKKFIPAFAPMAASVGVLVFSVFTCAGNSSVVDYNYTKAAAVESSFSSLAFAGTNAIADPSVDSESITKPLKLTKESEIKAKLLNQLNIDITSEIPASVYINKELKFMTENSLQLQVYFEELFDNAVKGLEVYEGSTLFFADGLEVRYDDNDFTNLIPFDQLEAAVMDISPMIGVKCEDLTIQKLDYETEYKDDKTRYEGYTEVVQEGKEGVKHVRGESTYINNQLTCTEIIEETVVEEPVNKIVKKGVLDKFEASGTYLWPVPYTTTLTSTYGVRWGSYHNGIDISAGGCFGKDIVAADAGVVTFSGDCGDGYGSYVILDHGNGRETVYAHSSKLYVKKGEKVAQGQRIAAIGSTGNSTGPHLHFEVRINGQKKNPELFDYKH